MTDLCYEYWWASYYGLTDLKKCRMFEAFGNAKEIYLADAKAYEGLGFLSKEQISSIQTSKQERWIEKKTEEMIAKGISLTTLAMEDYPKRLRCIPDAPYGLFYVGDLSLTEKPCIGMVGARRASAYGRTMSEHFAMNLAAKDYVIVSGMARGIDGASHRGALKANGKSIAVLGGGVEFCYPKENREIYEALKENGLVISQYCPGTMPIARFFPARNRIISGLSDVIMVMEAKEKSGSLITVDFALEQGRDIYAMPGRITDTMSLGCNLLIRQGAGILQSPDLFLEDYVPRSADSYMEEIERVPKHTITSSRKTDKIDKISTVEMENSDNIKNFSLEKEESLVYSCFDFYARSIQDVADETGLDLLKLISIVMRLCELGLLKESFKNQYIRCK